MNIVKIAFMVIIGWFLFFLLVSACNGFKPKSEHDDDESEYYEGDDTHSNAGRE